MNGISELRQDIVTGEWVVIAIDRGKRPNFLSEKREKSDSQPKRSCPFERRFDNAVLEFSKKENSDDWWVQIIPNKYPAFGHGVCALFYRRGPYQWTQGVGYHEVVITRDHTRHIALMSDEEVELVVRAYQSRFLFQKEDSCVEYISIFHNHGKGSGASVSHPHSQIIATPVVPIDVGRSLSGAQKYFEEHGSCVQCVAIAHERKVKDRLIYENEGYVALAPFASKTAFSIKIYPKKHNAHFETIGARDRKNAANALRTSLALLHKGLKNPDYNFFLHTAPTGHMKKFENYHWHFEILPKTYIWAGFELSTGMEISSVAPEVAAAYLRRIRL